MQTQAPRGSGAGLWTRLILALSLSVNLLIAGIFIGSWLSRAGPGSGPGAGYGMGNAPGQADRQADRQAQEQPDQVERPRPPGATRPGEPSAMPPARLLRELGLGPFIAGFPPEKRRQMLRDLREALGPRRAERTALLQELQEMLAILRSEPFDAAAFGAVMDRQKQRLSARAEVGRDVIVAAIAGLTSEERLALADSFAAAVEAARRRAESREAPPAGMGVGGGLPARPYPSAP